jgi:diguanylate cyclase (GGDEF)-like protein
MALDPLTGLEGPASWSRIVEIENARLLRYRRPVTVVMAEVEGLKRLAERLGDEPVDRLLPVIAGAFRREARSSDWVARVGHGRFAAFLPETDEIQAINYVERIRLVCEPWLTSSAVPLRLAIGWSSPTASSDIESALQRAEERMHLDRRMPGKSVQAPRVVPPRVVSVPRMAPTTSPSEGNLVDSVPPAETGRAGEWIGQKSRLKARLAANLQRFRREKAAAGRLGRNQDPPVRPHPEPSDAPTLRPAIPICSRIEPGCRLRKFSSASGPVIAGRKGAWITRRSR